MTWESYLIYLTALAVFFATPPDTSQLLVISNSLKYGVRRSLATVAGDLSANMVQMTVAAFGLASIIAASAQAFQIIKWLGVAYLGWIGLRLFFARRSNTAETRSGLSGFFRLYRQGFVTSSANPYAVIFFAALFPQFIDPSSPISPQLCILGGTYLVVDGVILVVWGLIAVRAFVRFKLRSSQWINRTCGTLMMTGAVLLAGKDLSTNIAPR